MNERVALYGWIARHGLDAQRGRALFRLAGYEGEPDAVKRHLWTGVAIAAAALGGFGVILWLAANWNELGRSGRFALLQGAVLAMCAGAALHRRTRAAFGLMALLAIGGLFAYFGQTYQTGADPWQLFALWAALAFPLCLAARSDVLWAPWALVVSVAISLWLHAHIGHRWQAESQDLPAYVLAWLASVLLVIGLGPAAAHITGSRAWALRTATVCTVVLVSATALFALFGRSIGAQYLLALLLFAAAGAALSLPRWFEVFQLSAVALGLDALLVAGAGRLLFEHAGGDDLLRLLLLGVLAAGVLAATVSFITRLAKRHD